MRKGQTASTPWEDQHHAAQPYYDRLWAKMSVGLRAQAAKRLSRAQAKNIEVNSVQAAGSFKQFQHKLKRDNGRLFAETVKMKAYHLEQVKALSPGREVKLLPSPAPLALPFPWHFVQLGLCRMQAKENLAEQDRHILAVIKGHCFELQHLARQVEAKEHYKRTLEPQGQPVNTEDFEHYLDHICARQARRDGWRADRSSPLRPMDVLNPFKWIAAFIEDSKGVKE